MKRLLLAIALLCGFGAPASAATLIATATEPVYGPGSFTIGFNDTNHNGLFDLGELTSFSGFSIYILPNPLVSVLSVPEIPGISTFGQVAGSTILDAQDWNFEESGSIDLHFDLAAGVGNWTYQITGLAPVPLPATGMFLLAGLGGLAAFRRRRS